jgi:ABC-type multidrug transport system fused ATPase/permease subunit
MSHYRTNILYGKPGGNDPNKSAEELKVLQEEMERAAEMANIHKFILTLPGGYDSPVGTKGLMLSGMSYHTYHTIPLHIHPSI